MMFRIGATMSGAAYLAAISGVTASAHESGDYFSRSAAEPISERTDPRFDPKPIERAGFLIKPEAVFSGGLQSNTLATELNEIEDSFVGFTPAVSLDSDWIRHALSAYVEVDHREYSDLKDESRTNLKVKLRGRLDLSQSTSVVLQLTAADETEDRTDLSNIPTSLEPNEYTKTGVSIGLGHRAGRYQVQTKLGLNSYDYDDTELAGELFQDQDFRDRDELTAIGRLSYALDRSTALYAQGKYIEADYTPPNIFNAFNRDHSGAVLLAGTDFEIGRSVRGDIGVGYQYYTYDDESFEDISDFAFVGHVDWMLSPSTTVSADAERSVMDPGVALSNAAIETGASVRLEQGLTSKIYLTGEAGFTQYAFETIDRDDDRVDLSVGANWKINPNIWLEGGYQVIDQTSDVQAFTDNRMLLKMRIFP